MSENTRITIDTVYGQMVINKHDTIRGRSLIEYGKANDHPEIELLVELLKRRGKESVAIDVGANFGCFTLAFAPHCARVIAMEMQIMIYADLVESIRLGAPATDGVIALRNAAGRNDGADRSFSFPNYFAPRDFGSIALSPEFGPGEPVIERTIDSVVRDAMLDRVDLLKIDVEGMEMDVLLGAEQTINQFHPILYVEYIHSDLLAMVQWIKVHGYERVRKVGNNLLADPSPIAQVFPIVQWPGLKWINDAWPTWRQEECHEWNRLSEMVDRLTIIEELQGDDLRRVERIRTRLGRSLSERCPHGILLWLECAHCNTQVEGDLPTLLSPAALTTLERLAESAPPGGCFVEVGVYRGGSAQRLYRIAQAQGRDIWLFDTFIGLVDRAPVLDPIPEGHFDAGGVEAAESLQAALPNAWVIMGTFPAILSARPDLFGERAVFRDIAFAHVDCDQYASISRTLWALWPRMVSGGIILCDDYDTLSGAQAAVNEFAWASARLSRDKVERTSEGKAVLRKP